jgi:CBS domain-containing protein
MDVESLLKKRSRGAIGIPITATIQECVTLLVEENLGALLVYDAHEKAVGIITERDIVHGFEKWGALLGARYVSELMTAKPVTCFSHDSLKDLMPVMIDRGFRHLPVVEEDDDEVIGMISMRDLIKERISEMELEANVLRDMAAARSPTGS